VTRGPARGTHISVSERLSPSAGLVHLMALCPCRLWVTIRAGRACGLCNVSDLFSPRRRVATVAKALRGSLGETLLARPNAVQLGVLYRAGAQAETLGVMPSVLKRTRQPDKGDRQFQRRLNRRSLKGLVRKGGRFKEPAAQGRVLRNRDDVHVAFGVGLDPVDDVLLVNAVREADARHCPLITNELTPRMTSLLS